ncbi:MAG TPA: GH92 family glycosyl hydrolase [Flavobacteriales bacterium]|nr:GH92 family glycosyl hydrolase [Flavobacteriales bacterium]HMR26479.1 GH92 family glycosyl hydrolase [Flavobacteriales bacterium]
MIGTLHRIQDGRPGGSTLQGLCLVLAATVGMTAYAQNPARDLVNPFVGTGGHGHTFPGACVPHGLVQLSPDTRPDGINDWDGCGGYHHSDSVIYGFSHTHLSGTGVADLCDVLVMPMSGRWSLDPKEYRSTFSHANEAAHAGYYRVHLEDEGVDAELTATARVGVHRYTIPQDREQYLVIDLSHRDKLLAGHIRQEGLDVVGERRSSSWAVDQRMFFCMRIGRSSGPVGITLTYNADSTKAAIAVKREAPGPLIVKVGISAVSIEGARRNLEAEVPHWDFDRVRAEAEAAWNAELNKVQVKGGTPEQQRIFATALYHSLIAPCVFNDVDGQYRGMDGAVHRADHNVYTIFSLWDTFRATHPLFTLLEPDRVNDYIRTFLLHYQQGGRLPVWELWGNETDCMIGYHSASVIADAHSKGIRGYDARLALEALVAGAMRDEPGLNAYRTRGYISSEDQAESVSRTLEYAYDDWCIAQLAEALGEDSLAAAFTQRAYSWQNLLDPGTRFFRARRNGGMIEPFDPYEVNYHFTEANAWQYGLFVPHHLDDLLRDAGGSSALRARLDELFDADVRTTGREQADITGLIGQYAHGNEPSHHMAYLYARTDAPAWMDGLVGRIRDEFYRDAPDGLIGNEDCGQMSSWYVLSALGIYPICPGSPQYTLGVPLFDEATVQLAHGRDLRITAERTHADARYVEEVTWNGREPEVFRQLSHDRLMDGGTLAFRLGPRPGGAPSYPDLGEPELSLERPLPAPWVNAPSRTFTDTLAVHFVRPIPYGQVEYRMKEGGVKQWRAAPELLTLRQTGTVQARLALDGRTGPVVEARFERLDVRHTVSLQSTYANQYAAGGDQALVDGLRGSTEFRSGEWQGFQGQDVLATIDLGGERRLDAVSVGMLQDQRSWIWYPEYVDVAWSINGRQWSSTVLTHTVARDADGTQRMELRTGPIGKRARYVKVMAKNAGPCPDWHPSKGGASWIFLDEIGIEAGPAR